MNARSLSRYSEVEVLGSVLGEEDGDVGLQMVDGLGRRFHVDVGQAADELSRVGFPQRPGHGVDVGEPPVGVDRTVAKDQAGHVECPAVFALAKIRVVVHAQREAVGLGIGIEVAAHGLDGKVDDRGIAGAGLAKAGIAFGVAGGNEALPADESVVLGMALAVASDRKDAVEGVVKAGVGQLRSAAADPVAALPLRSFQTGDAAEFAVEEMGPLFLVYRGQPQGGLHGDVREEFAGHEKADAEVVLQEPVHAVARAAVAAAQNEEVSARGG